MAAPPTLHLMVGLPGVGKTTLAAKIQEESGALRLTPDEWMEPLFGDSEADGKRDVLEGRLIWIALQALQGGLSLWSSTSGSGPQMNVMRFETSQTGSVFSFSFTT
ncbi:hypothetical protein MN0502_35140 (plasmid) [Arthrobacter sp. MN05-02]|nr:hypothetical protein MN0502_35140 [Arthrobacter sp. MN05-02]